MRAFTAPLVSVARTHHASSLTARNCRQSHFFHPFIFTRAPRLVLVDSCHFSRFLDSSIKVVGADYANEVFQENQTIEESSTFTSCVFVSCHGDCGGAVLFNVSSSAVSFEKCSFLSCSADINGGACYNGQWTDNQTFAYCCFVKCTVADSDAVDKAYAARANSRNLTIDYVTCRDCDREGNGARGKLFADGANQLSSKHCNFTSGRPMEENWNMECFMFHFIKFGDAVCSFHHVEGMRFTYCYDIGLETYGRALQIDNTDLINIGFDASDEKSACFHTFNDNGCPADRKLALSSCNVFGVANNDGLQRHFFLIDECNDGSRAQPVFIDCWTSEDSWSTDGVQVKSVVNTWNNVDPDNEQYCAYETSMFTQSVSFTETPLFKETERFTDSDSLIPSFSTESDKRSTIIQPDSDASHSVDQSVTAFATESSGTLETSEETPSPSVSSNEHERQSESESISLSTKSQSVSDVESAKRTTDFVPDGRTSLTVVSNQSSRAGAAAESAETTKGSTHDNGSSDSGGLSGGQIAGIVIGVIAFIAIIVIVIVVVVTRRKRQSEAVPDDGDETEGHETDAETIPIGMIDFNSTAVTANNAMFDGEASSDPFRDDLEESVLD